MKQLLIVGCNNTMSDLQYIVGILDELPKMLECDLLYIPLNPPLEIEKTYNESFTNIHVLNTVEKREIFFKRIFGGLYKVICTVFHLDYYENPDFSIENYENIICIGITAVVFYRMKRHLMGNHKMIFVMTDPVFLSLTNYKDRYKNIFRLILKYFEIILYRLSDYVVFGSKTLYEMQKKLHSKKIHYKFSYFNFPYFKGNVNKKLEYPIKIGYFGTYRSNIRNIIPFYNVISEFPEYEFYIVGDSDLKLKHLDNLTIYSRLDVEKCKELEANMHILVSIGNLSGGQIPGKTFFSSNYQKPIIYVADDNSDFNDAIIDYLKSFNRFIICDNNDESIADSLRTAVIKLSEKIEVVDDLSPYQMCKAIYERVVEE